MSRESTRSARPPRPTSRCRWSSTVRPGRPRDRRRFLDHMLTLFSKHGLFRSVGPLPGRYPGRRPPHRRGRRHRAGQAFRQRWATKPGSSAMAASPPDGRSPGGLPPSNLSGAPGSSTAWPSPQDRHYDAELVREFFVALAANALMTLHLVQLAGQTATMSPKQRSKPARARSTPPRVTIPGVSGVPSTKGSLDG